MFAGGGRLTLTSSAAGASAVMSGSGSLTLGASLTSSAGMSGMGTLTISAGVAGPATRTLIRALGNATLDAMYSDHQLDDELGERFRRAIASAFSDRVAPRQDQVDRLTSLVPAAQVAGVLDSLSLDGVDGEEGRREWETEDDLYADVSIGELYELQMIMGERMILALEPGPQSNVVDRLILILAMLAFLISQI